MSLSLLASHFFISLHLYLYSCLLISFLFPLLLLCVVAVMLLCVAVLLCVCVGWLLLFGWLVLLRVVVVVVVSLWSCLSVWHAENHRVSIQNASVCPSKTLPCMPAPRAHVETHGRERRRKGVINHQFCLPKFAHGRLLGAPEVHAPLQEKIQQNTR